MAKERNYGIDLLRIVAMFFVVTLLSLGRGGILAGAQAGSALYKSAWLLEILAYCAVDVFALISGYVSYSGKEKRTKYSNYFGIWFQVVFYGLVVTAVFNFIMPRAVTFEDYLTALFPVTNGLYWYFTAYTALFVIMPLLNAAILHCGETTLRKLFVAIIIVFSLFEIFVKRFAFSNGYSFIWITLLYVLGAIIKKCDVGKNVRPWHALLGITVLWLITYFYKMYGAEAKFLAVDVQKGLFVTYFSPTVLGIAILFVVGASKLRFHKPSRAVIGFFAPATFAVYLLNNHRYIWEYVMKDLFVYLSDASVLKMLATVIGFSAAFAVAAMLVDRLRILLFDLCRVNKLTGFIDKALDKCVSFIAKKI